MAKKKTPDLVETGQEIVKKKKPRGGNNFLTDAALKVEDGDNTKYLMANVELMNMPDMLVKILALLKPKSMR